jgi:hypothetical protein
VVNYITNGVLSDEILCGMPLEPSYKTQKVFYIWAPFTQDTCTRVSGFNDKIRVQVLNYLFFSIIEVEDAILFYWLIKRKK